MALASIRNERDLIVINALSAQTTAGAFATTTTAGDGKIFNQYGATPTGKEKFSVYLKHLDGRVKRSSVIDPDKITAFKKQVPVAEVLPSTLVTVTTATAGDSYAIYIKIFNDGALSNEDCMLLNGFYEAVTGDTVTTIAAALVASLNAAQTRMGQTYFTVTNSAGAITIQSINLPYVVGKKDGRQLDYTLKAVQVNPGTLVYGSLTVAKTAGVINPCGINYLYDLEWQTRGAFGDSLRELAYPDNFPTVLSDIVSTTAYTLYEIDFYGGDRNDHAVQKSPSHLTVAVPAANVAAFDTALGVVRQVIDLSTAGTNGQALKYSTTTGTYTPTT